MAGQIAIAVDKATLFDETVTRARELSTLYAVATVISQSLDIDFIVRSVMRKVLEIFDFDAACTFLIDSGGKELRLVAHEGFSENSLPHSKYQPGSGITGKTFERGEPILFEDIQSDSEFRELSQSKILLKAGFRGLFSMPIASKGKTLGVMSFANKSPHRFSPEEVRLICSIASHVGIAVENATNYRESRRREEIQGLLKEISQDITSLDINSLLKKLTKKVCGLLKVDVSDVRVLEGERWHVKGLSGIDLDTVPVSHTGLPQGRSSWIVSNSRALMIPDITQAERIASGENLERLGVRGYLGVPLFSRDGKVIGVLRALSYGPREFTEEEIDLLQQLANGTAIALENANLFQEVHQKSEELEALVKHLVSDNAQQMGSLIDDLLTFSRLNRQPVERQSVALAELVDEVLKDMGDDRDGRRIDVTIGDLPVCQGDPSLLKLVFVNLLSNAFKFTRQREVAVIEIGCRGEGGERIYYVRDNGVAFNRRYADKLFGVFQRLHRTEDYEGAGLGLATVQRIIQRHGGQVWAEGEVDKGATFYFTLEEGCTP
jgi:GAF domain-containing protein